MKRGRAVFAAADVVIVIVAVAALLLYTQPAPTQGFARFYPQNAGAAVGNLDVVQFHAYNDTKTGYTFENQSVTYVVGVIKNNYSQPLSYAYVTMQLLGTSGQVLYSWTGGSLMQIIAPGQTSPMIAHLSYPPFSYEKVAGVKVISGAAHGSWPYLPGYEVNAQPYTSFSTTVNSKSPGGNDTYAVEGIVSNTGSQTASEVQVTVSLYDASGNIVGAGYAYVPESMAAGSSTAFTVDAITFSPNVASVMVQAEGLPTT